MKAATSFKQDRNWFIVFSAAFAFGIGLTVMDGNGATLAYTVIAFALFIHSGVTMELRAHHAEHDHDGNG